MKRILIMAFVMLAACAHKTETPEFTVSGELALQTLAKNSAFVQDEAGNFETRPEGTEKIRIFIHQFANPKEAQGYVLNRRMLLHKGFQDQIAPYFGLIQLNRECLAKVDTKGEPQQISRDEEFIKMQFPANDSRSLSDCNTEKIWGSIEYRFHNCKKTHTVYEIRISRKDGVPAVTLQPRCT